MTESSEPTSPTSGRDLSMDRDVGNSAASCNSEAVFSERDVREFIGWMSGDVRELNGVEVPRIADSWERFKQRMHPKGDNRDVSAEQSHSSLPASASAQAYPNSSEDARSLGSLAVLPHTALPGNWQATPAEGDLSAGAGYAQMLKAAGDLLEVIDDVSSDYSYPEMSWLREQPAYAALEAIVSQIEPSSEPHPEPAKPLDAASDELVGLICEAMAPEKATLDGDVRRALHHAMPPLTEAEIRSAIDPADFSWIPNSPSSACWSCHEPASQGHQCAPVKVAVDPMAQLGTWVPR